MKSEFAFKVFLVTTCLFIVYLYAFLVFSFYVPYVDLILFFGFIWAFVKAREGEEYISAHYPMRDGRSRYFVLFIMHDFWRGM